MAESNNKFGVGLAIFAGIGAIVIGGAIYAFIHVGNELEDTFAEIEKSLEEEETVENVVAEGTEAPDEVEFNIPAPADVAVMPGDVTMTDEGVGIRVLEPGDGENFPTLADDVTIYYTGWTTDGNMFDSSHSRGEPDTFPLGVLIEGWKSAVPHMSKGEKSLIWIPGDLGYDLRLDRPDAPKGMLVFEIELVDFAPTVDTEE